ncbi:LOW QUALITY PROTEIN: hypothetical protein BT93_A1446 [Corymbia citriodora subsp. variegata]|nr:LOW QUALITY PROTEIN: hypothetical protein BT93_A1446 [Corymbia citriodora subsp. variegata]
MRRSNNFTCLLLSVMFLPACLSRDTITAVTYPGETTLVSAGERFELGFFSPNGISDPRRYIGIWYYGSDPRIIVWVANRDNPLISPTASFGLVDGNLKLRNGERAIPLTDVEGSSSSTQLAKLLDSGNLVLIEDDGSERILWQSFDHPTDTFLPGMLMNESFVLTSWASPHDPKQGNFTFKMDQEGGNNNYDVLLQNGSPHWKSGVYGKFKQADQMLDVISFLLSNFTAVTAAASPLARTSPPSPYKNITRPLDDNYNKSRLVMNYDGKIQYFRQGNGSTPVWFKPASQCSVFSACGKFGICNDKNGYKTMCRKLPICTNDNSAPDFLSFEMMRAGMPDVQISVDSEEQCRQKCLDDCSHQAYSLEEDLHRRAERGNLTCYIWSADLDNIQESAPNGSNLYVRVRLSDPAVAGNNVTQGGSSQKRQKVKHVYIIASAGVAIFILVFGGLFYMRRQHGSTQGSRESTRENLDFRLYDSEKRIKMWMDSCQFKEEDKKGIDVPFFDLEVILQATNDFSDENKLGRGGFGPVYKATFPGGQEIAVKRLLSGSGQGLEEFKTEVVLIAKLQHRNLVRLVGYCVKGDEKMLLYEYMPNKSLDSFIFDRTRCWLLTWEIRFEIVLGIARGMLYLHQDSRLRIIHRDLKTSNILLDEEMTPKISDFGLARIFEAKQTEASTQRVIGTYGYMSPKYALDGFFSFKSDVFSFGVVVLEIISGKRSTGFYQSKGTMNLLTHAWNLWHDNKALHLMDRVLHETYNRDQVLKCINMALLCVQEDPSDRPTMSDAVFMLGSETAILPAPKKPAFAIRMGISTTSSSSSKPESNAVLSTTLEGR